MLAALVPAMLVIAQPDLGSGMVYMAIAFMLLFVAGTPWQHLAALRRWCVVSVAFVLVAAPALGVHVLKPYQMERLTAFLHPPRNPQSKAPTNSSESKIAIGSGQKTGRGAECDPAHAATTCPRTTPTSCSRPSASSTASSGAGWCCCSTRC